MRVCRGFLEKVASQLRPGRSLGIDRAKCEGAGGFPDEAPVFAGSCW